jgi:hypothetical protein
MFSHIIIFESSLPEALGGQSLYTIICERVLSSATHLKFRVAKLVKSFGPLGKSAESLDDFRCTLSEF